MAGTIDLTPPDFNRSVIEAVIGQLTDDQQHCIMSLSDDWCDDGYSKIIADLIIATDNRYFPDRFPPLLDCRQRIDKSSFSIHHRLLPLGVAVKKQLCVQNKTLEV